MKESTKRYWLMLLLWLFIATRQLKAAVILLAEVGKTAAKAATRAPASVLQAALGATTAQIEVVTIEESVKVTADVTMEAGAVRITRIEGGNKTAAGEARPRQTGYGNGYDWCDPAWPPAPLQPSL